MFSRKNLPMMLTGLEEGDVIGSIREVHISRLEKRIDFFVIDAVNEPASTDGSISVLFYNEVVGIGNYAVMTMNTSKIIKIDDLEAIENFNKNNANVIGANLININGDVFGKVQDFFFQEKTGLIEKLVYSSDGQENEPGEIEGINIISIGTDMIIINNGEMEGPAGSSFPHSQFIQNPQYINQQFQQPMYPQSQFQQPMYVQGSQYPIGSQFQQPMYPQSQFSQGTMQSQYPPNGAMYNAPVAPMNYVSVNDALQEALKPKPYNIGENPREKEELEKDDEDLQHEAKSGDIGIEENERKKERKRDDRDRRRIRRS